MIKIYKVNKQHPTLLDQLNKKKSFGTILVFSDHCPHCVSMKPQWEQMKSKLYDKPANIYEINSEDLPYIDHPIKNVIDGFPTILNVNNRNIVPFEEERTLDNFIKFTESNILNMTPKQNLNKIDKRKNGKKVYFPKKNTQDSKKKRKSQQPKRARPKKSRKTQKIMKKQITPKVIKK